MTISERLCARAPVYGRHAMVVAGHSAATLAGVATLKRGGSIVDAMVSASAMLSVVVGQATSIGGDCFLLFHEAKTGRTVGLNASGVAPQGSTPDRFADGMQVHGPLAPVVPGLVRGWDAMHRRYGVLPWQSLFDDAIAAAEGFPVSHSLAERFSSSLDRIKDDPGCASVYMPDGRAIGIGDMLQQPALARTLRNIADDGADAFYRGKIAQRISAFFETCGGLIRADDLAAYEPLWVEPAASDYRGHRVEVMPPNSLGVLLLMQLNGLSALDGTTLMQDAGRRAGYQMSALKAAAELSKRWIADPRAVPDAVALLTGAEMTAQLQAAVREPAAPARVRNMGGTACLLIADEHGNAVSVVQSVFNVFGAVLLDPQTGILFNNRMQGFTHRPHHPNSVAPGKRPAHTLCPVLLRRDGRVHYALATPGGISQTLTNVQVINYLIDGGMDVAAAVDAPRWCNTKSGEFLIEPSFDHSIMATLAAMGHSASQADDPYFYGSAKAIELMPSGMLAGAGDRHREAAALGY
jgi:gamma-glutamyltranspeptidase/glutathione hydrolase